MPSRFSRSGTVFEWPTIEHVAVEPAAIRLTRAVRILRPRHDGVEFQLPRPSGAAVCLRAPELGGEDVPDVGGAQHGREPGGALVAGGRERRIRCGRDHPGRAGPRVGALGVADDEDGLLRRRGRRG